MRLWGLPLRGHGDSGLYTFCRWLAVPLFGGLYRCRVKGTEHLPRKGGVMVITNHKANIDPVIVGMICDRPLRYMAKKELFANPWLRALITAHNSVPIRRGGWDSAAFRRVEGMIRRGIPVLMLTAAGQSEQITRGYKAGAAGYLVKPFETDILKRTLIRIMGGTKDGA